MEYFHHMGRLFSGVPQRYIGWRRNVSFDMFYIVRFVCLFEVVTAFRNINGYTLLYGIKTQYVL